MKKRRFRGQKQIVLMLTKETNNKASEYGSIDNCYIASAFKHTFGGVTPIVGGNSVAVYRGDERLADYDILGHMGYPSILKACVATYLSFPVVLKRTL